MGKNWLKFFKEDVGEFFNLQFTGGIDCHKPSIFTKHRLLSKEEIEQNGIKDLF